MLTFSSHLEYDVAKDGTATLIETRTIVNTTGKQVALDGFTETLPESAHIPENTEARFTSGGQSRSIPYEIHAASGTSRRKISFPSYGYSPFVCQPGHSTLQTQLQLTEFYRHKENGLYLFAFHHRLPDVAYLKNTSVQKTVTVRLAKPVSPWLAKWDLIANHFPVGNYHDDLKSLSSSITLRFELTLQDNSYWANTIILAKRSRGIPIGAMLSGGIAACKAKAGIGNASR